MKLRLLLALLVSLSAQAEIQAPPEVQKLAEGFNKTMMECPQKIWSDYNWSDLKVVLVYSKKKESWVWEASTNTVQTISNSELPASALGSNFEFFELNGHRAISLDMNMKGGEAEVFDTGVHEFFHHIGQENWKKPGGRGTVYPLNGEPRFYRRMIYDNLKQHLQSDDQESLGRAKYWFDKWSNEFSNETLSTADGYEGTAQYTGIMAAAVAELGCSAVDDQLKESNAIKKFATDFSRHVSGQTFDLSIEGYAIGGLAALILRFNGTELSEWNRRMAAGETPLQVLLESVTPVVEAAPEELKNIFIQAAQKNNEELRPILDNDIANWNNKSYIRVPTPRDWLQSNLSPLLFSHSSELNLDLYPLREEHQFISPNDNGSNFRLKTNTVLFFYVTPICKDPQPFVTLVPENLMVQEGRSVELSSGSVVGRLAGEIKTDEQGFRYFCVE